MTHSYEGVHLYPDGYGSFLPAINVKCYFPFNDVDKVMEEFGCSRETAERALQFAYESHVESFWDMTEDLVRVVFNDSRLHVYREGRSGGWLVVDGLPEEWDADLINRWSEFKQLVKADIDFLAGKEAMLGTIRNNGWAVETIDDPRGDALDLARAAWLLAHDVLYHDTDNALRAADDVVAHVKIYCSSVGIEDPNTIV